MAAVDQASEAIPASQKRRGRIAAGGEVLAALAIAALLVAFDLTPQPPYGADPVRDAWHRQALVALALGAWALALLARRRRPRLNLLLPPLLLYFCVVLVATAAAPDPRLGVEPALDLLAAILIFWAFADCPGLSERAIRSALMLTALALALVSLHFVWERWMDWRALASAVPAARLPLLPPTVPRVTAIGTNPNIVAPLMTFTAPLYLVAILRSSGRCRLALVLGAAVVQAGIFFTLARAAWIGEAAALAVCGALLLLGGRSMPVTARSLRRIALAAAAALAVLACLAGAAFLRGYRPLWLFRPSVAARNDFRDAALQMIHARPLLGSGPGSFVLLYPYHSGGDPAGAVHAHNVPVQIAFETGLLGLAAAGLVALTSLLLLVRAWRRGGAPERALVACAAGAGAAFLAGGLADSLHLFPEILFVLGALMGAVLRAGPPMNPWRARLSRPFSMSLRAATTLLPPALAAVLLLAWVRIDQAARDYERSIYLASRQRWPEAAAAAHAAEAVDPSLALYHVQAALDLGIEAEQSGQNPPAGAPLRAEAIAELQRALALEPRSAATTADLALLHAGGGQMPQALALLPGVTAGAPRDSMLLLSAGVIAEQAGVSQAAIGDYAAALAQSPRIADSPFWQETAFRRQNFAEIVRLALARAGGEDSSGGPSATREIIEGASGVPVAAPPSGLPDFTARINRGEQLTSQHEYAQAATILQAAVAERSDDPAARLALGNLYAAMGETEPARRQWLAGAYLGDAASIAHLIESWPAGQAPAAVQQLGHQALTDLWARQFEIIQQHYRFAFRRQEPYPITLPSDALNALPKVYSELEADLQP